MYIPGIDFGTSTNVEYLVENLGRRLTYWILNDPHEPFTEAQISVARALASLVSEASQASTRATSMRAKLSPLAEFDDFYGTTRLNYLRELTAGALHPPADDSHRDNVLAALCRAAAVMYGGLL